MGNSPACAIRSSRRTDDRRGAVYPEGDRTCRRTQVGAPAATRASRRGGRAGDARAARRWRYSRSRQLGRPTREPAHSRSHVRTHSRIASEGKQAHDQNGGEGPQPAHDRNAGEGFAAGARPERGRGFAYPEETEAVQEAKALGLRVCNRTRPGPTKSKTRPSPDLSDCRERPETARRMVNPIDRS